MSEGFAISIDSPEESLSEAKSKDEGGRKVIQSRTGNTFEK